MTGDTEAPERADWVFGIHGVRALLAADAAQVRRVVVAQGRRSRDVEALRAAARAQGLRVEQLPAQALARLVGGGTHQGIAAERNAFAAAAERELEQRFATWENPLLVLLDGIEDPRNLGACLRTAEAAGADAVLLPKRGNAPLSGTVAKAASGAVESLFLVEVANLARRIAWLKERGIWIVGAAGEADAPPYTAIDYRGGIGIAVGGEHSGLRRLTRDRCDHLARIPMAGAVTSLNVSVALGVMLFEAIRQRG